MHDASAITLALLLTVAALEPSMDKGRQPNMQTLTAEQILDRMASTYAGCSTYHDSGVVRTVFIDAKGRQTTERPFTTNFVRPGRFRFELRDGDVSDGENRYIVWRERNDVQTWWHVSQAIEKCDSLGTALAGATGVSGGSAHTAPALLMPNEIGGGRLTELTRAKRIEDDKLGEAECFRIEGRYADSPMTLWLDKSSFFARRIDSQHEFDDFRTEKITTYEPVIDEEIPGKLLEFNPPEQK